jgi:hypothetical protein
MRHAAYQNETYRYLRHLVERRRRRRRKRAGAMRHTRIKILGREYPTRHNLTTKTFY